MSCARRSGISINRLSGDSTSYAAINKCLKFKIVSNSLRIIRRDLDYVISFPNVLAALVQYYPVFVENIRLANHCWGLSQFVPSAIICSVPRVAIRITFCFVDSLQHIFALRLCRKATNNLLYLIHDGWSITTFEAFVHWTSELCIIHSIRWVLYWFRIRQLIWIFAHDLEDFLSFLEVRLPFLSVIIRLLLLQSLQN